MENKLSTAGGQINLKEARRLPKKYRATHEDFPEILRPGVVLYTQHGVARVTGRGYSTVGGWISSGELQMVKLLTARAVTHEELVRFLEEDLRDPGRPSLDEMDLEVMAIT